MIKISKLLEEKSAFQNEIYKYKEIIKKNIKEKEDLEEKIKNLENQNNILIKEKQNLIQDMNHIDSRIKSKGPKTTDISKKFQNIGQSSMNMIRTNIGLDSSRKKNQNSNISLDSGKKEEKNENYESAQKSKTNIGLVKDDKNSSGNKNNRSNNNSINNSDIKDKGRNSARINNNK